MMKVTKKSLFLLWIKWQFWEVPRFLLQAWGNFLRFVLEYFSVPLLIKTFFAPWRKYKWEHPRGFDVAGHLEAFFSNMISKTIGAICRSFLILVGIIVEILTLLIGGVVFLSWLVLPLVIGWLGYHGIRLLVF